jgi:hypothetical protein
MLRAKTLSVLPGVVNDPTTAPRAGDMAHDGGGHDALNVSGATRLATHPSRMRSQSHPSESRLD